MRADSSDSIFTPKALREVAARAATQEESFTLDVHEGLDERWFHFDRGEIRSCTAGSRFDRTAGAEELSAEESRPNS